MYLVYCFSAFVLTLTIIKYSDVRDDDNADGAVAAIFVITIASLMPILMISEIRGISLLIALIIPIAVALTFKAISSLNAKNDQANE
jgi:hypothetical protein